MQTKILKINPLNPEKERIKIAAEILQNKGLVAFPTETVYGLGADALNPEAVKKIFIAKGRPADNPLIVHIANIESLSKLSSEIPKTAEVLAKKFWPGPLTIILKKNPIVPNITTAGMDTVAIRMPSHKIALELIKESNVMIAAPSANTSGKPSPTTAKHVIDDLNGKVDAIIDGGDTEIGVESTVIDLTSAKPLLLRPGKITLEELQGTLGEIEVHAVVKGKKVVDGFVKSPGMKYRHYAPKAKIILIEGDSNAVKQKIQELILYYKKQNKTVGIMAFNSKFNNQSYNADIVKTIGKTQDDFARNLFKTLREFDEEQIEIILAEGTNDRGIGLAVMNRLRKAASFLMKV